MELEPHLRACPRIESTLHHLTLQISLKDQHEGRNGTMDKERVASVQNRQQDMLCVYTSSSFFLN